jgi:hypothetical protein
MACKTSERHCENCGSTDYEDINLGDQGYTACCNELATDGRSCNGGHERETAAQAEIDALMRKLGYRGEDGRTAFIAEKGLEAFDALVNPIFKRWM